MGIESGVGLSYADYRAMNGRQILWRVVREENGSYTSHLEFNGKVGVFPADEEEYASHSQYTNAESFIRAKNVVSNGDGTATGEGHLLVTEGYFTFALACIPITPVWGKYKGKKRLQKNVVVVFKVGKIIDYQHAEGTA